MDEFSGDDGISVSVMGDPLDWRFDEVLTAQIQRMNRAQRHQAAFLALRRLQAPLLEIEMPGDWGIEPAVIESLVHTGAERLNGELDDAFQQSIAQLMRAPLFESEIDPELAESFQLEAIGGWILLGQALGELSEVQTDRIIILAREQADYLDQCIEGTLMVIEGEDLRGRYLESVDDRFRSYGLGYFATRNLEVESQCHEVILAASDGPEVFANQAGRELLNACDTYSAEVLSALRSFPREQLS
ncbi:hypothetical protein [Streptomyces sp. NRRL S-37]|uniref:hypothetical protein n=1 Tax=Streptomyces sp. NRRL S-37 TaxID=1463903 RepID=UPI001F47232E|nr:hypothetical protein [Streptomyces sp. NRRL S-37]